MTLIGVGHTGIRIVEMFDSIYGPQFEYCALDSDSEELNRCTITNKMHLHMSNIAKIILWSHQLSSARTTPILTCALGGFTTNNWMPILCGDLSNHNIVSAAIVSMPLSTEGQRVRKTADETRSKLLGLLTAVAVVDLQTLLTFVPLHTSVRQLYQHADLLYYHALLLVASELGISIPPLERGRPELSNLNDTARAVIRIARGHS